MNLVRSAVTFISCILIYYVINIANSTTASYISGEMQTENNVTISSSSSPNNNNKLNKNDDGKLTRKPVKLTMKQGLIMNQVIATYGMNNVQNALCKQHIDEFKLGLRAFEAWALQMFDSSSKLQSGILFGNLVEFGSFQQCLNIYKNTRQGPIRGKLCSFRIIPGSRLIRAILGFRNVSDKRFEKVRKSILEGIALIWSVCIPHSCTASDVFPHFNKSISEMTEGLDIEVTLSAENCVDSSAMNQSLAKLGVKEYCFLLFLAIFALLVAISTLIEWKIGFNNRIRVIGAFSIISNGKRLLAKGSNELNCLHGIRFLSVCYVMFGHRFMTGMLFPSVNSLSLLDWIQDYSSTVIIGGTICVDTFFLVSGTLVSYVFFKTVTKTNRFNLLTFYVHRYIRITLPLIIPVIIYSSFIQLFGSGPLWRDTYTAMQKPCQYFWWSTLLHIQNYVNPTCLCIPQTWYLTCDMLYYLMSPSILYPLWKWPCFGYVNYVLIYFASILVNFILAWINRYEGGMPLTNQLFTTKYFQRHYIAPHARASPYIIGLGLGYALFKHKGAKVRINFIVNAICWTISCVVMSTVVVGSHVFQNEHHDYNRMESSLFLACSRSAWTLGIVWIIWSCTNGYGGIVNSVLSMHWFRVLGRTGYGMFLFHLGFQFMRAGASKAPGYFSNFNLMYESTADLTIMLITSVIFTLFIEYPFLGIESLILEKKNDFINKNNKTHSLNN